MQILVNSADGIVTIEPYSVSGIPNYSLSRVRRFKLNSDTFSPFLDSNKNLSYDGSSSSAEKVMQSSFPETLRIFDKFSIDNPKVKGLSHL